MYRCVCIYIYACDNVYIYIDIKACWGVGFRASECYFPKPQAVSGPGLNLKPSSVLLSFGVIASEGVGLGFRILGFRVLGFRV